MKNKIILSGLFLTSVISCSAYRPLVLNAFLDPTTTTNGVQYDDLNWSYALFNQYASGLNYKFRINYSNGLNTNFRNGSIYYQLNGVVEFFTDFTTITSTFAEGELNSVWKARFNRALFNREFSRTTGLSLANEFFGFRKIGNNDNTSLEIIIDSNIAYNVSVGSLYMAYQTNSTEGGLTSFEGFINFYNGNNNLLNSFRFINSPPAVNADYNQAFDFSSVVTNVRRFSFMFRWIDIPPYISFADNFMLIREMNLFTQNQEISIPDDAEGDTFGFEFVAVEWWNILGHLQNFAWWIVNKSPIAPVFEWIDTYVITWISGLITFIVGVFDL